MNAKELAEQLNGAERRSFNLTKEFLKLIKESNLAIIYGESDDLVEFRGAIHDEIGAYNGTEFHLYHRGLLPSREQLIAFMVDGEDNKARDYFNNDGHAKIVEAIYTDTLINEDTFTWTFATDIPHETFDILDNGEKFCRGIIVCLDDLNVDNKPNIKPLQWRRDGSRWLADALHGTYDLYESPQHPGNYDVKFMWRRSYLQISDSIIGLDAEAAKKMAQEHLEKTVCEWIGS